jgi:hypothetical protein
VIDRAIDPATGSAGSLERSAQTLPVPLGGLTPVHRHSTTMRRTLRRHPSVPLVALALATGGAGVWLSTSPRAFTAGQDAAGIEVGGLTLTPIAQPSRSTQSFTGVASVVIDTVSSGVARAGAVMTWDGFPTTVRCVLVRSATGVSETCAYDIGTTRLTSADSYSAKTRTWSRRYSDGMEITITVPNGSELIPLPFPLGR